MKKEERKDWRGIWVFAEQEDGCLAEVSFELLSAALALSKKRGGMEVCAVLLGAHIEAL
ncbi:MAG: electron transfer flavoprotein subunit alpha, partial [Deltaproteobacteria bacterium]|nr:electron transfer flavoprotein subunit alpha [Deltaproteobacteria bacterium]